MTDHGGHSHPTSGGPLAGWRVLIPRPAGRSGSLMQLLGNAGAQPHAVPFIEIVPPDDLAGLDAAVLSLGGGEFDWVAFSSVNAVTAVLDRGRALSVHPAVPADTQVAAVGPATATAVRAAGLPVDLLPERGSAADLAQIWPRPKQGNPSRVLLPQSEIALPTLGEALVTAGHQVAAVTAYRTVPADLADSVREDLTTGAYDAVLVTSPSTVQALTAAGPIHRGTAVGVVGASTAAAAARAGLGISFTADQPTDAALVLALLRWAYSNERADRP